MVRYPYITPTSSFKAREPQALGEVVGGFPKNLTAPCRFGELLGWPNASSANRVVRAACYLAEMLHACCGVDSSLRMGGRSASHNLLVPQQSHPDLLLVRVHGTGRLLSPPPDCVPTQAPSCSQLHQKLCQEAGGQPACYSLHSSSFMTLIIWLCIASGFTWSTSRYLKATAAWNSPCI